VPQHYWVLISLMLTIVCTVVLLLHMPTVSALASIARKVDGAQLGGFGETYSTLGLDCWCCL
jgi:hypothetical protein